MWFEHGLDDPRSDYDDVLKVAVGVANNGDIMVEVGSFVGESTARLVDLVRAAGKQLDIYAVDLFDIETMILDGDHHKPGEPLPTMDDAICPTGMTARQWVEMLGPRAMLAEFYDNLAHNGRDKALAGVLVGKTAHMASRFVDGSVRFCYLDASHGYEGFSADLSAWYPKMRPDGILAGHDWYSGPSIRRAVKEFADAHGLKIGLGRSSWILAKPDTRLDWVY